MSWPDLRSFVLNTVSQFSFYYGGTVGNELGSSDPAFMKKYGKELEKDSGKWIDSSVWHGKARHLRRSFEQRGTTYFGIRVGLQSAVCE